MIPKILLLILLLLYTYNHPKSCDMRFLSAPTVRVSDESEPFSRPEMQDDGNFLPCTRPARSQADYKEGPATTGSSGVFSRFHCKL
jgi:hypothetical protein